MTNSVARRFGGLPGLAPYFGSKFGLLGFSGCVFEDVRHLNIKVTTICPGNPFFSAQYSISDRFSMHWSWPTIWYIPDFEKVTLSGPIPYLPPEKMIKCEDLVDAIDFVLECESCPTEICLDNQQDLVASIRELPRKLEHLAQSKL